MELLEAHSRLIERLQEVRESAEVHRSQLSRVPSTALSDFAAFGVDTNVLKALRRDVAKADTIFATLKAASVSLIAPGQAVVEYWNNHHVFASEEWSGFLNDFKKLQKRVVGGSLGEENASRIGQIESLIEELMRDLDEQTSPEYLSRSRVLMEVLLENGSKPMVSRAALASLADTRLTSRVPPGFADAKSKAAATGDFFLWCDFMLGCLCLDGPDNRTFGLVTDDAKPDWVTGGHAHPSLAEEFYYVTGGNLVVLSFDAFRRLVQKNS